MPEFYTFLTVTLNRKILFVFPYFRVVKILTMKLHEKLLALLVLLARNNKLSALPNCGNRRHLWIKNYHRESEARRF